MKKIVIDARGYSRTSGRYTRKLIEYLEKLESNTTDRSYTVLMFEEEFDDYTPRHPLFSKRIVPYQYNSLSEQIGYHRFLNSLDADLVHFTMPQQPALYRRPHVTTVHDLTLLKVYPGNHPYVVFKIKQTAGTWVFRRIGHTSHHIITPSEYTKQEYVEFANIDPARVTVTYEAADITPQKPSPYTPLVGAQYILYVGQQSNYKNLRRLMTAHQKLLSTHPNLQLVFVGKTNNNGKKDRDWAESQGYRQIHYTGFVKSDARLAWLYANAQAYVFPSLMEGFGLPGLEAMCYGTPLVSSNATCLPEIYGDAAVYFDPYNVDEMAETISEVISSPATQKSLVRAGKARLSMYSWKRMAEQTLSIYLSAL